MGQIISVIRRCLPLCFPLPESEDRNEACQVVVVEDPKEEVQSNSTTTITLTSMAAQTLSSSSESCWDHDVFLSFRGEDTRKNFIDHLYSALVRVGIHTFRDDEELRRGKTIATELLNAIRGSRISIVVFSKGYASSRWCLDELIEIVHNKNTKGHTLFPIFYHVDPSDVRKQIGTFAEAFARHEELFQTDMERVQRWREALTEAANCSGWDLKSDANGYESIIIQEIVDEVLCEVNPAHLNVAIHPVGIQSRVEKIKALLNLGTNNLRIVGICGMGGIGKTTLAKAVYNEICHGFEGSSFLSNIKEISKESNGLVHLQEQLLYDILHKKNWNVYDVDRGISLIKERIQGKKVFVVLDDVDHFKQLHALVGNSKLFGPGSRLIATTRDEQVLTQLGVDGKYKVEELNHRESIRLFKWHAFKMTHPIKEYQELSVSVVKYTRGLPLALVVLGSSLLGKSVDEWKSKLKKLQKIPDKEIQEKLKISFDSLDDDETKNIFLDIACFFIGMEEEYVIKILDACDFYPDIGLKILIQRSLVTIDDNKLRMHDLIRDMGREIVLVESPRNPGRRSRLWFHEDILKVLSNHMGSETIEGLILNLPILEGVPLQTDAFRNMKNLRLLQINDIHLTGSYENLPKELKWICWHKCPLNFLPQKFHLENLVILDMQHSNVKQVWKKKKNFNRLKVLNLSNSKDLATSPDFSRVQQLEILILEGCTSLVQVHESIGHLKRLVSLNLKNCTNLKYLPKSIFNLESLKTLGWSALEKLPEQLPSSFGLFTNLKAASFSRCSSLTELPNFLHAPHLESLELEYCTSLVEIHESIGLLKRLVLLNLQGCENLRNLPSSISNLTSLKTLLLSRCLNLAKLPKRFGNMTTLTKLFMANTAIKQLPPTFRLLRNLETLSFHECECLIESPEFLQTSRLQTLILEGCTSLVEIHESIGFLERLVLLNLKSCEKLRSLPSSISNLESLETLNLSECYNLKELPEQLGNMKALKDLNVGLTAIKQLPSSFSLLKNLKNLIFFGCECLIESPQFSQTSCLEQVTFEGCTSLVKIHESIGHLKRLKSLDLQRCKKLRSLPISRISNLECLGVLRLSGCLELDKLPEQWGNMKALWNLEANGTAIEQLPSSLSLLSNLSALTLPGCGGSISPKSSNRIGLLSISKLRSLIELDLSDRNLSEDDFPEFECLSSLKRLSLSRNNFRYLPSCISRLPKLEYLHLNDCTTLQSISLPISVNILGANGCTSLERISILTNESLESSYLDYLNWRKDIFSSFDLNNCHKLVEIQNLESLRCVPSVHMEGCNNLSSDFRKSVLQMMCKTDEVCSVLLPGSEIPNWISHQAIGSSISFRVPSFLDGKMGKVLLCIVYAVNKEAPRDILAQGVFFKWRLCNKSSRGQSNNWDDWHHVGGTSALSKGPDFDVFEDHILAQVRADYLWSLNRGKMKSGDEIEVAIHLQMRDHGSIDYSKMCGIDSQIIKVKRCGIHLLVE